MDKRIRIKDIAAKAGVSKGTVDRVLHKRGNVSPDALERVMAAMEELDYQPNFIASALASNRVWKFAVLLPEPDNDPFWQQPLSGIQWAQKTLRDYGVSIDLYRFEDANPKDFQKQGQAILSKEYHGVLVSPSFSEVAEEFLDNCAAKQLKYILFNTYLERNDPHFIAYIGQDSFSSGTLAGKLLNFGMSSGDAAMILHLEKEVYSAKHLIDKEKGFEHFFQNHPKKNIQIVKSSYGDVFDKKNFELFLRDQFKKFPDITSIFVTTSKLFHLVPMLKKLGKEDIKLVGFDLIENNLQHLYKEKIHFLINQNPHKQGFLGIMNLFNYLVLKKEVKQLQNLPLDVVMKENVQYYLEEKHEKLHIFI